MPDRTQELLEVIPRLRRYARALTRDAEAADELVQDCLERAWSRLGLWRPGSNMRTWLFTILHNLYVNRARQAARRPAVVPLDRLAPAAASVRANQDAALEAQGILAAMSRLPEEQRQVLLLVGLEGMSYRQAAEMLGVPTGTVMSRLSRGRAQLRRVMTGDDPKIGRVK